jgi:tetratricopeptide (TPR) repeat protein
MKGQKSSSKNAFSKYLQSFPNGNYSADAHYYLGAVALEEKNYPLALQEFKQTIEGGNSRFMEEALSEAADLEYDNKNYAAAYQYYNRLNLLAVKAEGKDVARIGMLRSAAQLDKDQEVVLAATQLINQPKALPESLKEAYFYRGKALINLKETDRGLADLRECASDTRYVQGAEAQFILAETYYKAKSYDKAVAQVTEFMKKGTPHEYWMARALIVLSDTYAAKGDKFSAKQYLESLKDNYKGTEGDIAEMIASRLSKIN